MPKLSPALIAFDKAIMRARKKAGLVESELPASRTTGPRKRRAKRKAGATATQT